MVRRTVDTTPVKLTCARLVAVDSQREPPAMPILMAYPDGSWIRLCSVGGSVRCEMYGWDVVVTRQRVMVVGHTPNKTHEMSKEKPPT